MFILKAFAAALTLSTLGAVLASPAPSPAPGLKISAHPSHPALGKGVVTDIQPIAVNVSLEAIKRDLDERFVDSTFIICPGTDCNPSGLDTCYGFDLITLSALSCYETNIWYMSAEVYSPSGNALDYAVYGARTDCEDYAQFPTIDSCYNTEFDGVSAYFMTFFFTTPT